MEVLFKRVPLMRSILEQLTESVQDSNGLVRFDSLTITNKIIMKKKTITIGALLLAMNSFSQTDTLAYSISGKEKFEFDYYSDSITNVISPIFYKDFKFKLKKDEILYIDLFDNVDRDTLYLMSRGVSIYYRDSYVEKLYFNSNDNTLTIDSSLIKKVIVHKPKLK